MVRTKSKSLICEVEAILGHRRQDGVCKFRIKWKGYGEKFCTWQSEEDLKGSRQILAAYKANHLKEFPEATPKRRSTRPTPGDNKKEKEFSSEKSDDSDEGEDVVEPSKPRSVRPTPEEENNEAESSSEESEDESSSEESSSENDDSDEDEDVVEVADPVNSEVPNSASPSPGPSNKRPRLADNNEKVDEDAFEAKLEAELKKQRSIIAANPDEFGKKPESKEAAKELPEGSKKVSESVVSVSEPKDSAPRPPKMAKIDDSDEVIQDKPDEPKFAILSGHRIQAFNRLICENGELLVNVTYEEPLPDGMRATETVPTSVVRKSMDCPKLCQYFETKLLKLGAILPSSS